MKNIYLTEEQYVNYILLEYVNSGVLNESSVNLNKIFQLLYRGCRTFSDYLRRSVIIASFGTLSFTTLYAVIDRYVPVTDEQKQEIVTKVEETSEKSNEKRKNVVKLGFKISQEGLEHIKDYEKCNLTPYFATQSEKKMGIKTIGWGHKIIATDPDWLKNAKSISKEQAEALFEKDIKIYENEMNEVFKSLPKYLQNSDLYQQGFIDACISIIYNSGRSNFKKSPVFKTLAKCRVDKDGNLNKEDFVFVCSKIKASCTTQNGKELQGLVNRRHAESLMAQRHNL